MDTRTVYETPDGYARVIAHPNGFFYVDQRTDDGRWTMATDHRFTATYLARETADMLATQYAAEQSRRWAALDASAPCSHTIPGTCDYCIEGDFSSRSRLVDDGNIFE